MQNSSSTKSLNPHSRMRAPSSAPLISQIHSKPDLNPSLSASSSSSSVSSSSAVNVNSLHNMNHVVGLFGIPKFYHQGFVFRRTCLLSDGMPPKRTDPFINWSKYYVQITSTTLSSWNANEIEMAASKGLQVPPTYTNITDASISLPNSDATPTLDLQNPPSPHIFFLNNAGRNKFIFACTDHADLVSWVTAIRLASWERSRLFEIYTGVLLALRLPTPQAPSIKEKHEGHLVIRFPRDTEWTKVWCSISRDGTGTGSTKETKDNRWNRRSSLFGLSNFHIKSTSPHHHPGNLDALQSDRGIETVITFYSKKGSKKPIGTFAAVNFAAAVYPESKALIESSTMFKLEGDFQSFHPDGRPSENLEQGFILATPDDGTLQDMLAWLLGIMSAFKLYGRPQKLSYDPYDPSSFYFGYPIGPEQDHLFLDRLTAENLPVPEQNLAKIRHGFTSLLFQRFQASLKPSPRNHSGTDLNPSSPLAKQVDVPNLVDSQNSQPTPDQPKSDSTALPSPVISTSLSPTDPQSPSLSASVPQTFNTSSPNAGSTDMATPTAELKQTYIQPVTATKTSPNADTSELQDLETLAAYVSFPSDNFDEPIFKAETDITNRLQTTLSSSTMPEKAFPTDEASNSNPKSTLPSSKPLEAGATENDGYEYMMYALSLAEDPSSSELSIKDPMKPISSPNLSSPSSPVPKLAFLTQPPPDQDSLVQDSQSPNPIIADSKPSFPSSFAAGKKSAARLAAVQAAQAADKAASHRPGKVGRISAEKKKVVASWNSDSEDEDEDQDNEEEEEEEEEGEEQDSRLQKHRLTNLQLTESNLPEKSRNPLLSVNSPDFPSGSMPRAHPTPDQIPLSHYGSQFPNPAARREIPAVLRDQPAEPSDMAGMRPAFSQHGLLHRVMQERQEKSAKSIQEAAHWTGEPLVQVGHKPPPPQSGLLGAIANHERDRKRDGGMGAVLTARARERAVRQREAEMQKQSMMLMGGVPYGNMVGGGYPSGVMSPGMMPMMYNHQLMGAGAMMPNPAVAYEQMMFQQHQMQMQQQQAMMAAQQAYMTTPFGYSAGNNTTGQMMNPNTMGVSNNGMMNPHQSVYGNLAGMAPNNYLNTPNNIGFVGNHLNADYMVGVNNPGAFIHPPNSPSYQNQVSHQQ
ncbi:hypothetical protein O181_016660 [Austropuccinia psidii MF-1]|uniref:PH domain-containing protein n=1 Tax=Austropuccinia psidii MF-1 TaxID=1389203 RepID=A0A9Q3C5A9_9BASI|nr:hypothetical protein [Austropuccinia psidii MF-1]